MQSGSPKESSLISHLIVIFSLLAVSPFINTVMNQFLLIFMCFLLLVAIRRRVKLLDKKIAGILVVVYSLIVIQSIIFQGFSYAIFYFPLIAFYVPYLIYRLLGISFFIYFNRILFVMAAFTLPLWLLQSFYPPFDRFLRVAIELVHPYSWGSVPRSLLFYTAAWTDDIFNASLGIYRNSGFLHEPGAYGVFLALGITTNAFLTGKMFDKKNKMFILCLLTTLSTTAYIVLFIIISAYLIKLKINPVLKMILYLSFILISVQVYQSEEFLQSKIQSQYKDQVYAAQNNFGKSEAYSGRFFAFFTSVNLFIENPFFGRGIIYATSEKATGEMHAEASYTYGFMGVLATYGFFFGIFYLFNFFRGIKRMGLISRQPPYFIAAVFIAINLSLLTQIFITTTIIVLIFIIGIYAGGNTKKKYLTPIYNH